MPVGTRRSTRLNVGGTESEGLQSDSSGSQVSPRKRVSRATKRKVTDETIESVEPIPEESPSSDKPVSSLSHVDNKEKDAVRDDDQSSGNPEPERKKFALNKAVTSPDSTSKAQNNGLSEEGLLEEITEVTSTTEVTKYEEKTAKETISHGDVIKNVTEVYKQESVAKKSHKGMPKSGRPWKTEQTARFSDMRKDKPLKTSWQQKMAQKAEKLSVRKYQQELADAKREAILLKKQRREEHQKKKEENQKKSEVVQVIKNPAKLKRMKKKQLRMIQKRP